MPKYDGVVTRNENASPYAILKHVQPGSDVLEFGCATGYMTRYMKEELHCRVTIVEYDEESFQMALAYAEDGLCGDAQALGWYEKFEDKRYDAILFADVLEHLTRPDKVLAAAGKLLKDTGHIYLSIPNITHNDILLKAFADRFDYTPKGLLDDTHVHFWGYRNLRELAGQAGLCIQREEATYRPTGNTEQQPFSQQYQGPNAGLLRCLLQQRKFGEAYQFILTLARTEDPVTDEEFQNPSIVSHLYLDTGDGFNAQQVLALPGSSPLGNGVYQVHYELPATPGLRSLRFDPIENEGCILRSLTVLQDGQPLSCRPVCAVALESGTLLPDTDPMVLVEDPQEGKAIVLDAEIQLVGEEYLSALEQVCRRFEQQQNALDTMRAENAALQEQLTQQQDLLGQQKEMLGQQKEQLDRHQEQLDLHSRRHADEMRDLIRERDALQREVDSLTLENQRVNADLAAYTVLVMNKEKYILNLETQLPKTSKALKSVKKTLGKVPRKAKQQVKRILGR